MNMHHVPCANNKLAGGHASYIMCLSIVFIIRHFGAVQILHIVSLGQLARIDLLCQGIVCHKRASRFH